MNCIKKWLKFFEQVSCFYREMFMLPLWNKYSNYNTDIWDSLSIFLEGYAFERKGRRPDYLYAGVDALLYCKQQNNNNFTQVVINMIWQQFSQLLNNQRLNPKNNPLYPSTNPNKLQRLDNKLSIIEFVIKHKIVEKNLTFASYLQNQIKNTRDIQNVFKLITNIRGIGGKIASFYLRDLVDVIRIDLSNVENRLFLQPVDVWVERTLRILSKKSQLNRREVADWIVTNSLSSDNVNPEHVNMGIWFFCSQIITSEYNLNRVLDNCDNLKTAQKLLNDYWNRIKNVCRNCKNAGEYNYEVLDLYRYIN